MRISSGVSSANSLINSSISWEQAGVCSARVGEREKIRDKRQHIKTSAVRFKGRPPGEGDALARLSSGIMPDSPAKSHGHNAMPAPKPARVFPNNPLASPAQTGYHIVKGGVPCFVSIWAVRGGIATG